MKRFILILLLSCFVVQAHAQFILNTVAGNGVLGWTGSESPATAASLGLVYYVYYDGLHSKLYIANTNGIRMMDTMGILHDVAGGSVSGFYGDGGPATAAKLFDPRGVVADSAGNIFISDRGNHVIRKIDVTGIITTIAGNHMPGYSGDGGQATAAQIWSPYGICIDRYSNLYFAEGNNIIRKITSAGIISTVAGIASSYGFSGDGGVATAAQFNGVNDVVLDTFGNIYISDGGNNRIRKVNSLGIITTIAGSAFAGYSGDGGPATLAKLNVPQGVTLDEHGNVYIVDHSNNRIRMLNNAGIINTIAGDGFASFRDDSCDARNGEFNVPSKVAFGRSGYIYVADINNYRVRRLKRNFSPTFIAGHLHNINLCIGAPADTLNALLSVRDTDTLQGENWEFLLPPAHGSYAGSYSTICPNGIMTPTDFYYQPATGYWGTDTFVVSVTDCAGESDTAIFYVHVDTILNPVITGADTVCIGHSIVLSVSGGAPTATWSILHGNASVSAGIVTGVNPGSDTVKYVATNGCGTDSTYHLVVVKNCLSSILPVQILNERLSVYPNPGTGDFSIILTSPILEPVNITITDVMGKTIKSITSNTNERLKLTMEGAEGIYYVMATTAKGIWNSRVVLMK